MYDHLAETVHHCCITQFPHRAAKTTTKIWQKMPYYSVYATGDYADAWLGRVGING